MIFSNTLLHPGFYLIQATESRVQAGDSPLIRWKLYVGENADHNLLPMHAILQDLFKCRVQMSDQRYTALVC